VDESNAAVEITLQAELDAQPSSQIVELLASILSQPAFETLRTREGLGYLVDLSVRYDHGVYGLKVAVQSSTHGPAHLDERIEAFLESVPQLLEKLPPAAFANHRDALVKRRLQPPKTLRDEASLHWSEITNGTYDFERDQAVAASAAALTQAELLTYWNVHFEAHAPARRKLASHAFAPRHELPPKRERGVGGRSMVYLDGMGEVLAFKKTLSPFPAAPKRSKR